MVLFPFDSAKSLSKFGIYYWRGWTVIGTAITDLHTTSFYLDQKSPIPKHAAAYLAEKILSELDWYIKYVNREGMGLSVDMYRELMSSALPQDRIGHVFHSLKKAFLNPKPSKHLNMRGVYIDAEDQMSNFGQLCLVYHVMRRMVADPSKRWQDRDLMTAFLDRMQQYFGFDKDDENDWERMTDNAMRIEPVSRYVNYNELQEYRDSPKFEGISWRATEYKVSIDGKRTVNFGSRDKNVGILIQALFSGEHVWPQLRYQIQENPYAFTGLVKGDMSLAWENILQVIFMSQLARNVRRSFITVKNAMEFEFLLGLDRGLASDEFRRDMQGFYNVLKIYRRYIDDDVFEYLESSYRLTDPGYDPISLSRPEENPFVGELYIGLKGNEDFPLIEQRISGFVRDQSSGGASAESFFAAYFC